MPTATIGCCIDVVRTFVSSSSHTQRRDRQIHSQKSKINPASLLRYVTRPLVMCSAELQSQSLHAPSDSLGACERRDSEAGKWMRAHNRLTRGQGIGEQMGRLRRSTARGTLPLNSLTNVDAYNDKRWMELHRDLATYSYDTHVFSGGGPLGVYRKGWEWTHAIWGLEQLGMIHPQHRAIGVGAGRECVIFWLGDRLRTVVASDLYGAARWSDTGGREADAAVLEDPQRFCPRPIRSDVIEFKTLDGTDLGFYPADTFDFAWSLSSIGRFGLTRASVRRHATGLARVVRPGGIVAVATEYLLLAEEQTHPEYLVQPAGFGKARHQCRCLISRSSPNRSTGLSHRKSFSLIQSYFLHGIERTRRHVVLNDGSVQWTSVMFFLRKRSR